jgi:hypothetical protein
LIISTWWQFDYGFFAVGIGVGARMSTLCLGDEMLPTVAPLTTNIIRHPGIGALSSLRRLSAVLAAPSLALAEDANNLPPTSASCSECLRIRVGLAQSRVTCQVGIPFFE